MDESQRSSQEGLQEIFLSFYDVAWSAHPDTWETLFLSQGAEIVYGHPVAEFFDNRHLWRSLIHPDDRNGVESQIPVLFTSGALDLEYRIIRPNGEIRWLYHRLRLIRDAKGEALRIHGLVTDVTEQDTMRWGDGDQEFRALVENSPDIISRFDPQLRHLYVNPAVEQVTGIPAQTFIGKTNRELGMSQELVTLWEETLTCVFATGQERSIEFHFSVSSGLKFYQSHLVPEFNSDGTVGSVLCVARDITERQRAEEALHKSEERFRNLVETTSDWVWEIDENGFYTYVSPKVSDVLGYSAQELQGKTPFEFMPYREAYRITNFYSQLVSVQESFSCLETTRIHKAGHRVVMETSGVPIFDANGKFSGYRGISRDITERKRMEEALRESQQKYQALFEILPVGISIIDKEGNIIEANPASEQILGISTAEHTKRKYDDPQWQILRPDGTPIPASELAGVRAVTENRVIENLEMGMVKPDGEITWLSVTAAPIPLLGYGVVIAYIDITERKQAEQRLQLQAERERLMGLITQRIRQSLHLDEILQTTVEEVRQLLQNDRVLLFQLCSDGVGRVVTESMSPGLPAIVGREFPDEKFPEACYHIYYQGQPRVVPDITQDELAPCLVEFLQQLGVKSKLVIPILCSSQRGEKGDSGRRYRLATPTHNAQTSLWGVMVAHDCTGHRQWQPWEIDLLTSLATQIGIALQQSELYLQLEAQLSDLQQTEAALQQAKQAAEVANRAKSEFLANMSHELRTPLNGILGYAQILKKDTNLTDEQRNSLSIIHQCGEHLLTLINDILDLSKIEASRMELFPTEFQLPIFLNSLADLFKMRAQQRDIAFTYEIRSPLPQGVIADHKRLRQILSNLLSNAVKFTDRGGVTFRVGDVEAVSGKEETANSSTNLSASSCSPSPITNSPFPITKIRFQIEDTGIGIEPSKLAELFLPFHQVSDRAHAIEGTGLGLAISQKLVQMMGSKIQVKSTLGQGSVFWFDLELPALAAWHEPNSSSDRRIVGFKGHKRKVLTVDDHPVNRSFLRDLLQPLGFEIVEAVDGQDGLNKAQQTQPDLILMDLVMPGLDGLEVTQRLRQLPQFKDVVVIALSANVLETTGQESLVAGCQDFLPKPVQAKQLLDLLTVHLGLEWIYDDHLSLTVVESSPNSEPIVLPPSSELTVLLELVKMGDIQEILHRVEQLETLDEKFERFAVQICQLAKEFKLKQLQKLIQHYLDIR